MGKRRFPHGCPPVYGFRLLNCRKKEKMKGREPATWVRGGGAQKGLVEKSLQESKKGTMKIQRQQNAPESLLPPMLTKLSC